MRRSEVGNEESGDAIQSEADKLVRVDIHFEIEGDGCVHYRVIGSQKEDWSGWAPDWETAVRRARMARVEMMERLEPRPDKCRYHQLA
jgi:hypothetical protein